MPSSASFSEKPADKAEKSSRTKTVKSSKKEAAKAIPEPASKGSGNISLHLPKTLHEDLLKRMAEEGVSMDELITYLLMRGLSR